VSLSRWFVLALFFFTRIALGFQFQSAGSVGPFLIREFGLPYVQIGGLVGLYLLPGALVAMPAGFLGQRLGDKRVVLSGMLLMVGGGIVAGVASSYATLVVGRLISGTGAAFLVVLMSKMMTDWFIDRELIFAMSIYTVGWPAGIALGQASQAITAETYGWRQIFFLTALLLALALIGLLTFYRDVAAPNVAPDRSGKLSWREVAGICIAGAVWMLLNASYLVLLTFAPALLVERDMSIVWAAFVVSFMSWVSMAALPLGGYISWRYKSAELVMFAGVVASIAIAAFIPLSSQTLLLFGLFGLAYSLALPVVAALPAKLLSPSQRSLGFGIYWVWFYAGIPLLTSFAGLLRDYSSTAATPVFFSAVILVVTLALLTWLRRLAWGAKHV
jgi:predicted MFS family arabinose efflux permease